MKSISVIMATRNTEHNMLKNSIESILNQTFTDFEFIIVCDGSEDDLKVVKEYDDERIQIIVNDQPEGLPKSLNKALDIAKGKYIARMDSDDYSLKNRLKIQFEYMENHNDIDICSTYSKNFGNSNRINVNVFTKNNLIKSQLLIENAILHPTVFIRKKFLDDNAIRYSEKFKYSQDFELWNRIISIANFSIIPKVLLYYRVHANQISTAKFEEQCKLCEYVYKRNLDAMNLVYKYEYTNYFLFLAGKVDNGVNKNELKEFINLIVNGSSTIVDKKSITQVLYFNYFKYCLKFGKMDFNLLLMIETGVLKKLILLVYYKLCISIKLIKEVRIK